VSGITVNGRAWEGPAGGSTISDLVAAWCPSPRGVAVARNGEVVPRSQWAQTPIGDGDRMEIVTAAAGG
jgi:sulfur carrier protein